MNGLFLGLLLSFAASSEPPPDGDGAVNTIVVTGAPLSVTRQRLADCLARRCPPDEDIAATLAHAENLFVEGDYREALAVARRSIGRNDRHAASYPIEVANLYRAHARVSGHLGERQSFRQSTFAIGRSLSAGLPESYARLVGAEMENAHMYAELGDLLRARAVYRKAAKRALEIGRPDLAGAAKVRTAWLFQLEGNTRLARRDLTALAADEAEHDHSRLIARILLARLDRLEGKADTTDQLVRELAALGQKQPILLFTPKIEVPEQASSRFDDKWIDVGFFVTEDGSVADIELLRASGDSFWADAVIRSISGRLYLPSTTGANYRVERYSYTSWFDNATGTRLKRRSGVARIDMLDMTAEP